MTSSRLPTEGGGARPQRSRRARRGLGTLLFVGFASVLALLLVVSTTAVVNDLDTRRAVRQLIDRDGRIADAALRGIALLFKARRHEKDFLLSYVDLGLDDARTRYIAPFRVELAELFSALKAIPGLTMEPGVLEQVSAVMDAALTYERGFIATVDLIDTLGQATTGIEGEMRTHARELEDRLAALALDRVTVDLLQLRRHEKDYLLRALERDIARFRGALAKMRASLEQASVPAGAKTQLIALADAYGKAFERYVDVSTRIEASKATYQLALQTIEPTLEELHARASGNQRAAAARVGEATDATIRITVVAAVIALLLGVAVALLISHNIGRAVRETIAFASRVAGGDLATRLPHTGKDEFGRLATALNAMTDALESARATVQQHAAVLEQRVAERTRELERANADLTRYNDQIRRYAAMVEGSDDAIISEDLHSVVTSWNPAAETLFGYRADEAVGRHVSFMIPPGLHHEEAALISKIRNGERVRQHETVRIDRKGEPIDVSLTLSPIRNDSGTTVGATVIIRDIRLSKKLEAELRSREASLRDAQEIAQLGNWEWDITRNRVTWSAGLYRIFGIDPSQFEGTFAAYMDFVHPDDRHMVDERLKAALDSGLPFHHDHRIVRRDGTVRVIHARGAVSIYDAGGPKKMVGTAQDVTERHEIEEALRASQERFELAARATNDAVWDWDLVTGSMTFSESFGRLFGYTAGEYEETVDFRSRNIHPDDRDRMMAGIDAFIRSSDDACWWEYRFRCNDGSYAFVFDRAYLKRHGDGQARRMVGSMMNITRQKEAEDALRQATDAAEAASRAKSEFLANMSHEIRTPMNGVLGTVSLLLSTDLTPPQRQLAELARMSGEGLLDIIDDILDISKIEAGKLAIEAIPFDLLQVVEDAVSAMGTRASEKKIDLVVRYPMSAPRYVIGDPARIRQVLLNLLGNAVKFTDHGQVVMNVEPTAADQQAATFRLSVQDTGIGIAPQKRALIFEKFTQADASTTRRHGGTGLGLTISRDLVELMGGTIGVESEEGKGSTFWVMLTLPLAHDAPFAGPAPLPADLTHVRVLVVDDNAVNRHVLNEQAIGWKMRTGSCASGAEALNELREAAAAGDPYGIAIVDDQMPDMDGVTLGRTIKADPAVRDTVLVMLTSSGAHANVAELKSFGFAAYLIKPVRRSDLLSALQEVWTHHATGRDGAIITRSSLRATGPADNDAAAEPPFGGARVLLAEDNPTAQVVSGMMLRALGCVVDVAGSGREALQRLDAGNYDIVFMDCEMPLMDGFEATAAIRARDDDKSSIPIVAVTAQAMQGDRERCLRAGMSDYLSKPVRQDDFAGALERWIPARAASSGNGAAAASAAESATPASAPRPGPALDADVVAELRELAAATDASFLDQVCGTFKADAAVLLAAMRHAAEGGDTVGLRRAAHALKGAAGSIGARQLAESARQLHDLAESGSLDGAAVIVSAAEAEFARVTVEVSGLMRGELRR